MKKIFFIIIILLIILYFQQDNILSIRYMMGFTSGIALFYALNELNKKKSNQSELKKEVAIWTVISIVLIYALNTFYKMLFNHYELEHHFDFALSAIIGFFCALISQRTYIHFAQKLTSDNVVKSVLERDSRTDVRNLTAFSDKSTQLFDPEKFFKPDAFFIGLNEKNMPIYWTEETLPHVEVCGMTGSGKGVFIGSMIAQCLQHNEAVFVIDPKNDEWLPHVAFSAAQKENKPYFIIDLRKSDYQFNIFQDASEIEVEELLLSGFDLGNRGEASDFYKLADREKANFIAKNMKQGDTAKSLYEKHHEFLKEAENFSGKLRELAEINAVNAETGICLKEIIKNGGMVYIIGSMRNEKIIRIQKMLLVRLIQLAESRDRVNEIIKPFCVVLDELKYHLSKTALESLGAARDKGLHLVLAHQSIADLKDCPADLNPDAVVGAVLENTRIKLIYRVEMPETAEVFAKKSGTILVDDETRTVERQLSLAESVNSERTLRQSESYLFDENMILNLPSRAGILFGIGTAQLIYTSPMKVEKNLEAIETQNFASDNTMESAEPDFDNL